MFQHDKWMNRENMTEWQQVPQKKNILSHDRACELYTYVGVITDLHKFHCSLSPLNGHHQ